MNVQELRQKTVDELKAEHVSLLHEQFNLRLQKSLGQSTKGHELKRIRRSIARLLTIIHEKIGA